MIKPKVNTDKVITTIKKSLYELREVDFDKMTEKEKEKEKFRKGFEKSEGLALSILDKIKDK